MRGAIVIILHAFAVQATTNEYSMDMMVDNLVNELIDQVPGSLVQSADLDETTLGSALVKNLQPLVPSTVGVALDKLRAHGINPGPLGMLALTAIDANNRGIGMRNVAAMAEKMPATKEALSHLGKEVVVRAEALKKEEMAGITAPLGFWDPVGFSTDISNERLVFLREAELKHGRVGMLATLGLIAGEKFSPLFGATDTTTPAALLVGKALPAVPAQFWGAAFVAASFLELFMINSQTWATEPKAPGDFGWDPLGLKPKKADELKTLQNKELNNGRLAMLAAAGIVAQEMVTGKKIF